MWTSVSMAVDGERGPSPRLGVGGTCLLKCFKQIY